MNINAFSIKVLFTLLAALFTLTGCIQQPLVYGVPESHWRSLTDEQKQTAIEGYYKQDSNHPFIYIPASPNIYYQYSQPRNSYYTPYNSLYDLHDSWEVQRERNRANYYEHRARELEQEQHYPPPPTQTAPPETTAPTRRCGEGVSCRQFKPRL